MQHILPARIARWLATFLALVLSAALLSCVSDGKEEVVVAFNLDSTQLGRSDSLIVKVYNGKAPGPGEEDEPVQIIRVKVPKGATKVNLRLSDEVDEDFSLVVTGLDADGKTLQTKHIEVEDFTPPQGGTKPTVLVSSLAGEDLAFRVGEKGAGRLTLVPPDAGDKRVHFASSDTLIIKVVGDSLVAVGEGKATITVTALLGGAKATFLVEVKAARIALRDVASQPLSLLVGASRAPDLAFTPEDATDRTFRLRSLDSAIAAIDSLKVVGKSAGKAKVEVLAADGVRDTFEVTVSRDAILVNGLVVKDMRGLVGDTLRVVPDFDPADATDKGFTLASQDTNIAGVFGDSLVARKLGRVTVEATSRSGGHKATFTFDVERPRFDPDVKSITTSKCAPCHVPPAALDWGDSALFVRSGVDALRRITRPEGDKDKMPIAGAPNGSLTARQLGILVDWLGRVVVPVKGVTVSDMVVNLGDTVKPSLVFDPPEASNQEYVLTSQDTVLAPVRGKVLIPEGVGQTTVQISGLEGNRTLSFKLTVKAPDFAKNLRPIIQVKCFPCHTTGSLIWTDSANFLRSGIAALVRLQLPPEDSLRMPLKGAPNGDLTLHELRVILGWLNSKVIPLKDFSAATQSMRVGERKVPVIAFAPPNANNRSFSLLSLDTGVVEIEDTVMIGKKVGTTQVQIRALELDRVKSVTVNVLPMPVDSVQGVDTAGAVGDTVEPRILFFPGNATNQGYTLSLPNPSTVVKLDGARKVVGLAVGLDTLRVTSTDGSKVATFRYTVGPVLPKALSVPDTNGTSSGTDLVTPRLIWTPAATTNKAFTLSIPPADTNIAAVRGTAILGKAIGTVNVVTATSVADPSVKASFKFTVGPVPVIGLSVASTVAVVGTTVSPSITWNPSNATTKTFSLSVLAPNTANLSVSGNTIIARHLTTNGVVRVRSLSDTSKFANWAIRVIRPAFTGSAARTVFVNRCGQCHVKNSGWDVPDWTDSLTVIGFRPATPPAVPAPYDSLILARANPALAPANRMPPTYATNPAALTAAEYKAIQDWLNAK